ncbi:MAG: Crp/Fnr family transcriptional regulator [Bacteroidaceae bacterium]|nr:Crp/Fnr family transcriptional regulator [Bacteroidaceae bacterium]
MSRKSTSIKDVMPKLASIADTLSDEQKELFAQSISIRILKKNECVFKEGDVPVYLFCLIAGKVKVFKNGVGGRTQIVRVVKPVEYFGYRAAFAGQKYVTSASAFETSILAQIPIDTIIKLVRMNPELGWFFIQELSLGLGRADERTVNLTQKHLQGRLAESLLFLKDKYGLEEDESTLSIYLSREDLANFSNMTTANAIRTLSGFAAEKIVAIDGRKIKLIDINRLEKISRLG